MSISPPPPTFLKKRYSPQKYYKDVNIGTYCSCCKDRHKIECISQVIVGSSKGTTFPTKIEDIICNAPVDTGTSRSCISESFYTKLNLPPFKTLCRTNVRSASGSNLVPLGMVTCSFILGTENFSTEVIVCKHLFRPLILGDDFLSRN